MGRRVLVTALFVLTMIVPATAGALPSLPSTLFNPSAGCGCHAAFLEQWRPSMHAKALTDPLYLYKLGEAEKATGGALGEFCNGCHAPIAVMAGELAGLDQSRVSPQGAEGVSCDFCHQVTGTTEPIGNTSQIVAGDGVKRGPITDPQAPHPAQYSEFHTTAEFCGACHDVRHPVNGLLLEGTYTEWKAGPYAAEGIVCQDCHMTPGPGPNKPNPGKAAGMGPTRDHVYIMTFAGGNVGLGDAPLAEERLKAAATLDLTVPEIAAGGDVAVSATITNVGAGHYLPTGLTEVRQMWLEVVATDADGSELLRERRDFGTVLKDAEGNFPVDLWDAVAFEWDERIPPKESVTGEYSFPMGTGPVTVEAALYYRSCSEEMAAKAGVEIPTTTMVTASRQVFVSAEQKAAAAQAGSEGEVAGDAEGGIGLAEGIMVVALALIAGATYLVLRKKKPEAG